MQGGSCQNRHPCFSPVPPEKLQDHLSTPLSFFGGVVWDGGVRSWSRLSLKIYIFQMRPEEVGRAKQDLRLDLGQQRILGNIDIVMNTRKRKGRYTRKI